MNIMSTEFLNKKDIDISFFLNELYKIKFELENVIINLEEIKKESEK